MAVMPEFQGIGIGSALIKEGLKRCKKLGFQHVVVLEHTDYYPKFVFVPTITKGIKAPFEVPYEAFMIYELEKDSLKEAKGTVQYPEPFMSV
jgi:putative acetyltransferase